MTQGRRQRGGQVVPGLPIWNRCPFHFTFGPRIAAYIQYCIWKICPPPFWCCLKFFVWNHPSRQEIKMWNSVSVWTRIVINARLFERPPSSTTICITSIFFDCYKWFQVYTAVSTMVWQEIFQLHTSMGVEVGAGIWKIQQKWCFFSFEW